MQNTDDSRPVALITGAARRIGAQIARSLHAAGHNLVLHYRSSTAEMQALCAELEATRKGSVISVQADLADTASLPGLVAAAVDHFGRLDNLVNNASAYYATPLAEATPEQWDALFAANARAPFFLAQAAAPHLKASQGAIVNIADFYALHPTDNLCAYAASKAALLSLTKSLALTLAPEVRVNAITPGAIMWPEEPNTQSKRHGIIQHTPLARIGTPEELAESVKWLISRATFTTGHVLSLSGGRGIGE